MSREGVLSVAVITQSASVFVNCFLFPCWVTAETSLLVWATKPVDYNLLFSLFSELSKYCSHIDYHVHMWSVSHEVSYADTCQIWMSRVKNDAFVAPHPNSYVNELQSAHFISIFTKDAGILGRLCELDVCFPFYSCSLRNMFIAALLDGDISKVFIIIFRFVSDNLILWYSCGLNILYISNKILFPFSCLFCT